MRSDQLLINEQIKDAVNAVLNKIRAEIDKKMSNADSVDYLNGLNMALMIINEKYR